MTSAPDIETVLRMEVENLRAEVARLKGTVAALLASARERDTLPAPPVSTPSPSDQAAP